MKGGSRGVAFGHLHLGAKRRLCYKGRLVSPVNRTNHPFTYPHATRRVVRGSWAQRLCRSRAVAWWQQESCLFVSLHAVARKRHESSQAGTHSSRGGLSVRLVHGQDVCGARQGSSARLRIAYPLLLRPSHSGAAQQRLGRLSCCACSVGCHARRLCCCCGVLSGGGRGCHWRVCKEQCLCLRGNRKANNNGGGHHNAGRSYENHGARCALTRARARRRLAALGGVAAPKLHTALAKDTPCLPRPTETRQPLA